MRYSIPWAKHFTFKSNFIGQFNKTSFLLNLLFWTIAITSSYTLSAQEDESKLVISRFSNVSANAVVNAVQIDVNNIIWVSTTDGIEMIRNISDPTISKLKGENIIATAHDKRLGSYGVSSNKLFKIESEEAINLPDPSAKVSSILFYKSRLWISTFNKGIFIYNPSNSKFENLTKDNSELNSDKINFIHLDSKDILWLGTGAGEIRIENDKWKNYHPKYDVINFYENKEGLWFLSIDDMWLVDYFNREYKVGLDGELYSGSLNDFAIDSKGRLYVASDKLVRYDPYKETTEQYTEDAGILSRKCTTIACDKNDNIWIGTDGAGLYRLVFGDLANKEFTATCLLAKEISCSDKSDAEIKVTVSGGQGPFAYEWSNRSLKGNNPKNVGTGEYTVTVTDQIQNRYITNISVLAPQSLTLSLVETSRITGPNKKDGKIKIIGNGGTGALKYSWSNGDKGPEISKLKVGDYYVTLSDSKNCTAVGKYTIQKEKFIPQLDMTTLKVGETLRMNELYFRADSTEITPESYEVLEEVYSFLAENPTVVIEIGGHTNTIPPHEYCDVLSKDRAKNVAEYFYNKGISTSRLSYKGYGKRQPITNSDSLEGRRKNQRVEIKIIAI